MKKIQDAKLIHTTKLSNIIGRDKVALLLKIYRFIEAAERKDKDSKKGLFDYPIDEINIILRKLHKLTKPGSSWLKKESVPKIMKLIYKEMLLSKKGERYQDSLEAVTCLYLKNYPSLYHLCEIYSIPKPVLKEYKGDFKSIPVEKLELAKIKHIPEKPGREKRSDAERILLFATYTLLNKNNCRGLYKILSGFLNEQGIKCPTAVRSAIRDLKKTDIKRIYEKYYHTNVLTKVEPDKGMLILSRMLPSWENIFK